MKKSVVILLSTAILIAVWTAVADRINTPSKLEVITPGVVDMEEYAEGTGRLRYKNMRSVTAPCGGYVTKYYTKVGEYVKKGQKIADFTQTTAQTFSLPVDTSGNLNQIMEMVNAYGYTSYITEGEKIGETQVYAVCDGYICSLAEIGETVGNGTAIATLSDKEMFEIKTQISESAISRIAVGQAVIITGDGFGGREYRGTVTAVSETAEQTVQSGYSDVTVGVTVEMKNKDQSIRPGYSVSLRILTQKSSDALVLPSGAVMYGNGESSVYVFSEGEIAKRTVATGIENEKGIEIVGGLEKTDIVVLSPKEDGYGEGRKMPVAVEVLND